MKIAVLHKEIVSDKFFRKLSTASTEKRANKTANICTYTQTVDKMCVSCVCSIYCGGFYEKNGSSNILGLWIMWISMLIC